MTVLLAILAVLVLAAAVSLPFWVRWVDRSAKRRLRETHAAPPAPERIRPATGACGMTGCPNMRPHSHVEALVKRLREKDGAQ